MWHADAQQLEQLSQVFRATLSAAAGERRAANDHLAHARLSPHFHNYLCDLLVKSSAAADVRAAAGINLKNCVREDRDFAYVHGCVLQGLASPAAMVRNITGSVVTALFAAHGLAAWPDVVPRLLQMAAADGAVEPREAAVGALGKICEDSAAALDRDYHGSRPADHVAAGLLSVARGAAAHPRLRRGAVHALNHLVSLRSPRADAFVDDYLAALFAMAADADAQVRRLVCTAFALVLAARPAALAPHIDGVVSYCAHSVADADDAVAMEACEFLLALSESPDPHLRPAFRAHLPAVVPVLLAKMVYSDDQMVLIELLDARDGAAHADRAEDVRPATAKAKETRGKHRVRSDARSAPSDSDSAASGADSDSDDDDDDDDELDSWNLRRCASATLDALSLVFPAEVIAAALPILQTKIVSPEWSVREAAILAFGAISKSCTELAADKLPELVPFLVDRMKDPECRVRQISCWTVSRYAAWVAVEAHAGGRYGSYFQPTFEAIVSLTLDGKKIVQEAACSALSSFVEKTDVALIRYYTGPLLEHFAQCFACYQRKNLIVLYDAVATFVDKIGPQAFNESESHARTLLPPLLRNWDALADNDSDLWPLLECMSIVAATMGEAFAPYAVPVYERALKILANAIQLNRDVHTDPAIEAPEKDFMVTSLDLIDGLVQGFKQHSVDLMQQHGADVMGPVLACLADHDEDVRQSAYALLGDLAIFACAATVEPHLAQVVAAMATELQNSSYTSFPVTNNAIWAFGEITLTASPAALGAHLATMVGLLVPTLNSVDAQEVVLVNSAICLGRIGCTQDISAVSPRLAEFIVAWCTQMMYAPEDDEKESAFMGMARIIQANPDAGMGGVATPQGRKNLALFMSCVGCYFEPSDKLRETFFQLAMSYKSFLGDAWDSHVMSLVDAESRGFIHNSYGV